jgi:hypothetical protein
MPVGVTINKWNAKGSEHLLYHLTVFEDEKGIYSRKWVTAG